MAVSQQEVAMGRPRELTEEEKRKLVAEGYEPVVMWVQDIWSDEVWEQIRKECEEIRNAEENADVDLWIESAAQETFRLIDEMESGEQ
jgi:hypothetical protein